MSSNNRRRGQTPAQRAAQRQGAAFRAAAPAMGVPAAIVPATDAPQTSSNEQDVFDLDAVAHEGAGERFRFKAGPDRRIWWLKTPEEVDWKENSTLSERATGREDMRPLLELLLGEEQYEDFLDLPISMGKVSALMEAWREWHGIELPESGASLR